jgi:hypothetical protein
MPRMVSGGCVAFVLAVMAAAGACSGQQDAPLPALDELLAQIAPDATWQSISDLQRQQLERHAMRVLEIDRRKWGREGLAAKERVLLTQRTQAMRENIDRVLGVKFSAELPDGFSLQRDVVNADLANALVGVYLIDMSDRAYLLYDHPEFRGWDGQKLTDLPILDDFERRDLAGYATAIDTRLRSLDETRLTPTEKAVRAKSLFTTRSVKHLGEPPVGSAGSFELAAMHGWPAERRPYTDDRALLDAYTASMFAKVREVNRGTLGSFMFNHETEFEKTVLEEYTLPPRLVTSILKLGNLHRTRTFAHPDHDRRCTLYSAEQRAAEWDTFTAGQISNADGQESMESYAATYAKLAQDRVPAIRQLAIDVVQRKFPRGSRLLTEGQRAAVVGQIAAETRPAAMLDTIYAALDKATGSPTASDALKAAAKEQTMVGGYADGEALRAKDTQAIDEMWKKARAYVIAHYSGYEVDLAPLIPARAKVSAVSEGAFALGGEVNIGLKKAWNKASLYSTVLHEMKHAIDQRSHRAVEGAALEGAATSVERQIWPRFVLEAMSGEAEKLPLALLITGIDNVRFTATTDATLKRYLRTSCAEGEPDTVDFVKRIVASYGYTDPDVLALRSQRAHDSTQYLQYDYGLVSYTDTMSFLERSVGGGVKVDAFLLQACGLSSARKSQAHVDRLAACVKNRRRSMPRPSALLRARPPIDLAAGRDRPLDRLWSRTKCRLRARAAAGPA